MKSILHDKRDGTCYLCILLHGDYDRKSTQEHHVVFGTSNRRLSEKYGLKVYLCMEHHLHDGGPEAVHRNANIRRLLAEQAQMVFEKKYPSLSFRTIFGMNYISRAEKKEELEKEPGFQQIDGVEGLDW